MIGIFSMILDGYDGKMKVYDGVHAFQRLFHVICICPHMSIFHGNLDDIEA